VNAITVHSHTLGSITRSSAIADKPRVLVCKVVEVWQDILSEYVDKKFTYICYRRLNGVN